VVSPLLSNILLTRLDQEMRRKGYQLTRNADDWVATCESAAEARAAVAVALRTLNVQFERRTVASAQARHLRPDSEEVLETGWSEGVVLWGQNSMSQPLSVVSITGGADE
jgi:hypothetical protein